MTLTKANTKPHQGNLNDHPHQGDLNRLSLTDALRHLAEGTHTAEQIINACYDRTLSRENDVGAWQYLLSRDDYLKQYHAHKDFYDQSPLKGLPIAIKDIIDTADMPTEMGSAIHAGRMPHSDASCVSRLKQAGGIIMGKTVTTEFAYFRPGKTANPNNLKHTPGGSSSGSAAAVADAMVSVALGSQTAASVIRPAAYCGTWGYVATRGEYSLRGVQPLAQSLDSLGMFARTIDDIKLLRALILACDMPTQKLDMSTLKIVVVNGDDVGDCSPDMHHAMETATQTLADNGAQIVDGDFGGRLQQLVDIHSTIMAFEVARNIVVESQSPDKISPQFNDLLEQGRGLSYAQYQQALTSRDVIDTWLKNNYGNAVFLAPAAPGAAPAGLDATGSPHMSRPWQVLGRPTVCHKITTDSDGLPLSVQLIGAPHSDDRLLNLAPLMMG